MFTVFAAQATQADLLTLLLTFLRTIYNLIRTFLETILNETIFKASSELSSLYSDALTLLITLTAFYLVLELVSVGKRIIKIILILGWVLLLIAFVISVVR